MFEITSANLSETKLSHNRNKSFILLKYKIKLLQLLSFFIIYQIYAYLTFK